MPIQKPTVSVIIPTRGRIDCVRDTLHDLSVQDYPNFDVWLVDQNDVPLQGLDQIISRDKLHHETMPPEGSHAGRNRAIFKTNSDFCVFIDDDVRIRKNFLSLHIEAFSEQGPRTAAIVGRVIQPKDKLSEVEMKALGRPARYNSWLGIVSGNFIGSQAARIEHIHECNFSARTEVLKKLGGFNITFKGNAYFEGADLGLRLIEQNYEILYRPEIELTHLQDGIGGNRVIDKSQHTYWFMRNYGLLNSQHMRKIGIPFFGAYGLGYVLAKALKNKNFEIAKQGLKGLLDGFRYFL